MTRDELIGLIAESTMVSKKDTKAVVEKMLETIKDTLKAGGSVYIRRFGTFSIKHRAEKKARVISRGEEITIPERDVPAFKASKWFFE